MPEISRRLVPELSRRLKTGRGGAAQGIRQKLGWATSSASPPPPPPPPAPTAPSAEPPSSPLEPPLLCWPLDHFYSPVANTRELAREPASSRVWPATVPDTPGLDWNPAGQEALLRILANQAEFAFPTGPTGDPHDYHTANEMFSRLDAFVLQGMLRHLRPQRVVEVGCGWSTLVTARVNREILGGRADVTCIEPYPPDFLNPPVDGVARLLRQRVEEVDPHVFAQLSAGDVLFIDSSHTVKTGGDVDFLVGEVLPRLAPGVVVHFHDIFLPWDYPRDWVLSGRGWNEQYLVRAFLTFNSEFKILLGVAWFSHLRQTLLRELLPDFPDGYPDGGGSLWIQRTPPPER